jgi:chaperonin GroES
MKFTSCRPLHDLVIAERLEPEEKIGSIHVPGSSQMKAQRATVIAVGKGRRNKAGLVVKTTLKPGDTILFSRYAGEDLKEDKYSLGEKYLILREDEVLAVLTS